MPGTVHQEDVIPGSALQDPASGIPSVVTSLNNPTVAYLDSPAAPEGGSAGQVLTSTGTAAPAQFGDENADLPQVANTVLAGPATGPDDVPDFRALVAADIAAAVASTTLFGTVTLISGSADPSAAAGVAATTPALYVRTSDGSLWSKTGVLNTNWTIIPF